MLGGAQSGPGLQVIRKVGIAWKAHADTETGIAPPEESERIGHAQPPPAIGRAIREGYDVRGYFAWSLADNYEWHYGYKALFGLARMDPVTYDRVFKPSARRFRRSYAPIRPWDP